MKSRSLVHCPQASLTRLALLLALPALAGAISGCDAQNDGAYKGEAQAVVTGTIQNALTAVPPDAELAIVWESPVLPGPDGKVYHAQLGHLVAEKAAVTPTFPSNFRFELHLPPPDTAITDRFGTGTPVALASLAVMRAGSVQSGPVSDDDFNAGFLGYADDFILYVPNTPTPYAGAVMGGVTTPGFHLLGAEPISYDEPNQARLDACQALAATDAEKKNCQDWNAFFVHPDEFAHPITIVLKDPVKSE